MSDMLRQIETMIEQSERGELKTSPIPELERRPPRRADRWDPYVGTTLIGHERQRAIVAYLRTTCLTVAQICEASGFTDAAVRHHLWFLEHQAKTHGR